MIGDGEGARPPSGSERPSEEPLEEGGPVGPFPSWRWLYGAVLVWFAVVVAALAVFTAVTDFGGP